MDHLGDIKSVRQQFAAALAAYPHDYSEACQQLLAADAVLAVLELNGDRDQADLDAWLDAADEAPVALAGRADQ